MVAPDTRPGAPGRADRQPIFQPVLILSARHAIYSRSRLPLQRVKALPEQTDAQVVEQSGEPFLLPFPCCFPHISQSLGHKDLALCRGRV